MGGEIVKLKTRSELKLFLKTHDVVIVKVSATWCGPCKRIGPQVNQLYGQLNNNVSMVSVDADDGRDIYSYLKVKTIPHIVNFVDGLPYDVLTSSKPNDVLGVFKSTNDRSLISLKNSLETTKYQ